MNFYSHAVVAERVRGEPGYVLGAMLPDFEGMASARIDRVDDATVRDGIACHHETDAAFHGAAEFVSSCARSVAMLTERGLPRGPARAVAHVGLELVLDSYLVHTYGPSSMYLDALGEGRRLLEAGAIVPRDLTRTGALSFMLARLSAFGPPRAEEHASNITERLVRMLRGRSRLAIPEGQEPLVTEHVEHLALTMPALGPALLAAAAAWEKRA